MAKILLVEDDKSLREIYGVRLMAEGYEIVSAGDGEEALAMAIKERPDLIVSDVMMPKISGFDMLDILRSTTETKDVKVIMMTALSSEDQRARGESLGADRYLVKSQVGIEDVVRTVHDVLGDTIKPATTPQFTAGVASGTLDANIQQMPNPVAPAPVVQEIPVPSAAVATETPAPVIAFPEIPDEPALTQPIPTPIIEETQAPVVAQQAPAFVEQPSVPQVAFPPQEFTAPVQDIPTPISQPAPTAVAPPMPVAPQEPVAPVLQPEMTPLVAPSTLPEPTAPFSSPAPASLGDRIIEPLTAPLPTEATQQPFDIAAQMAQALNDQQIAAQQIPPQQAPAQPAPEMPVAAPTVAPAVPTQETSVAQQQPTEPPRQ